jgi:hypothetical protein
VAVAVEETTVLEEVGALSLKGLTQSAVAFNVPAPGGEVTASPPVEVSAQLPTWNQPWSKF